MLVWLGKQYLGQQDKHEVLSTQRHVIDLTRISGDQLKQLEQVFEQSNTGASEGGEVSEIIEGVYEG